MITEFCMGNLFMFLVGAVNSNQPLLYGSLLKCFPSVFLVGTGLSVSLFCGVLFSIFRPALEESRIISRDTFMLPVNSVDIRHH